MRLGAQAPCGWADETPAADWLLAVIFASWMEFMRLGTQAVRRIHCFQFPEVYSHNFFYGMIRFVIFPYIFGLYAVILYIKCELDISVYVLTDFSLPVPP